MCLQHVYLRSFHGKDPSKNKKDKRFRKIQEEQERKRRNTGDDLAVSRLAAVQEQTATPYLVRNASQAPQRKTEEKLPPLINTGLGSRYHSNLLFCAIIRCLFRGKGVQNLNRICSFL